ncbi:hypothetical protein ACFLZC_02420 [Patescibacteria group bacterium]
MKIIIQSSFIACVLVVGSFVFAQINPFDIQFPVSELGNCNSMDECKTYCDDPSNQDACLGWAKDSGFVDDGPQIHEDFIGPGGCTSEQECERYCDNKEHREECLNFAVAEGFVTPEDAEQMRADMNRTGPGGCASREECDAFCSNPDNYKICTQSAVESGMMTQEEADFLAEREELRRSGKNRGGPAGPDYPRPDGPGGIEIDEAKVLELLKTETGPGGCSTMQECDTFCSTQANDDICMSYAIEHNLIPPEKIAHMKKMMEIDKMGGPGGCIGREECDAYCDGPEHGEECFQFGKEHGLIPPEEIEIMEREMAIYRKLDQGAMQGPGNCGSREECDAYCRDTEHVEECMNFSGNQGLQNDEELRRRKDDFRRFESTLRGIRDLRRPDETGDYGPSSDMGQGGGSFGVVLQKKSSGMVDLIINGPGGIQSFAFVPQNGSGYSGGISGCPSEFKTDSSFFASAEYPIKVTITSCNGDINEFNIDSSDGRFGGGGGGDGRGNDFGQTIDDFGGYPMQPMQPMQSMQPIQPIQPMPYQGENKCDFNDDGHVDDEEDQKCRGGMETEYKPFNEEYESFKGPENYEEERMRTEEEIRKEMEYQTMNEMPPTDNTGTLMPAPVGDVLEMMVPMEPPISDAPLFIPEEKAPETMEPTVGVADNFLGFVLSPLTNLFR